MDNKSFITLGPGGKLTTLVHHQTRGRFVEHLCPTEVEQQSVTKIIYLVLINLVTPDTRAKHEPFVQQTGLKTVNKAEEPTYLSTNLGTNEKKVLMHWHLNCLH
jgi:hypothetical protein